MTADEERIVAWLRSFNASSRWNINEAFVEASAKAFANAIERGDHRRQGNE